MYRLSDCVVYSVKDFRILKIVFFVLTAILLFDELRKEFIKTHLFIK